MKLFKKQETVTELAPSKTTTTIVTVVGTENGLIPFHIAHSLKNTKKADVLLIDNSISQSLFDAVPKIGDLGNGYEISVISNRQVTMDAFKKFDYVVVFLGYTKDSTYIEAADSIVLLSDYSKASRNFMVDFDNQEKPLQFVFFNKVTGRISEKLLIDSMEKIDVKAGTEIQSLEFTEEDAVGYISFQYDGFYPVGKMSKDYQTTMMTIIEKIHVPDVIEESEEETT